MQGYDWYNSEMCQLWEDIHLQSKTKVYLFFEDLHMGEEIQEKDTAQD